MMLGRNWCYAFTKCFDRISYCILTTMTSALCIVYERCVALGFHADIPGEVQMFLFAMLLRLRGNYLGNWIKSNSNWQQFFLALCLDLVWRNELIDPGTVNVEFPDIMFWLAPWFGVVPTFRVDILLGVTLIRHFWCAFKHSLYASTHFFEGVQ